MLKEELPCRIRLNCKVVVLDELKELPSGIMLKDLKQKETSKNQRKESNGGASYSQQNVSEKTRKFWSKILHFETDLRKANSSKASLRNVLKTKKRFCKSQIF